MSRPHFLSPKVLGSNDLPLSNCHLIAHNETLKTKTTQLTVAVMWCGVAERENLNVVQVSVRQCNES